MWQDFDRVLQRPIASRCTIKYRLVEAEHPVGKPDLSAILRDGKPFGMGSEEQPILIESEATLAQDRLEFQLNLFHRDGNVVCGTMVQLTAN